MSNNETHRPTDTLTRREALRSTVRLTSALTALGLSTSAFLTPTEARAGDCGGLSPDDPLYLLVQHALEACNMQEAIELYAADAGLSDAEVSTLQLISNEDLKRVAQVREHLKNALEERTGALAIVIIVHCDI